MEGIANERFSPFAKEEDASVFLRKMSLQIARTACRRAQPEVGQRRQSLGGPLVVQIRIAMVGPKEAVADPDLVVAAVVLIIAHEDVQLGIESDIVDVSHAGRENV